MKFWQAMMFVDEGKKVKRSTWSNWYVYFDNSWGEIVEATGHAGDTNPVTFTGDDMNARDWIVVE